MIKLNIEKRTILLMVLIFLIFNFLINFGMSEQKCTWQNYCQCDYCWEVEDSSDDSSSDDSSSDDSSSGGSSLDTWTQVVNGITYTKDDIYQDEDGTWKWTEDALDKMQAQYDPNTGELEWTKEYLDNYYTTYYENDPDKYYNKDTGKVEWTQEYIQAYMDERGAKYNEKLGAWYRCTDGSEYFPESHSCGSSITPEWDRSSEGYSVGSGVTLLYTNYEHNVNCNELICPGKGNKDFTYHQHTIDLSLFGLSKGKTLILDKVTSSCSGSFIRSSFLFNNHDQMYYHQHSSSKTTNNCGLTVNTNADKKVGRQCTGSGRCFSKHRHQVSGVFDIDESEFCCNLADYSWVNDECCTANTVFRKVNPNGLMDDSFITDVDDKACCPNEKMCVVNGVCYAPMASFDADSDTDPDICNSNGEWQDMLTTCDGDNVYCLCEFESKMGLCIPKEDNPSEDICYCDFEGRYFLDSNKPILNYILDVTPRSTLETFQQKKQTKIIVEIKEPNLVNSEIVFENLKDETKQIFSYTFLDRIFYAGFENDEDFGKYTTINDVVISLDGKYGTAAKFNGDSKINILNFYNPSHEFPLLLGSKKENNFNEDASYVAWIKPTTLDSENRNIFCDNNCNEGYIRMYDNKIIADFGFGNIITYEKDFEENQWYHVAMVHNFNPVNGLYELKLYLNGELIGTSTSSSTSADYGPDDKLIIGENFIGLIDEVQVYNSALDEQRINSLFSGSVIKKGSLYYSLTLNLDSIKMEKVIEDFDYYISSVDFSNNEASSSIRQIKLFDIENNKGNFEVKDYKINIDDKNVKLQFYVYNLGEDDFYPSIYLPVEIDNDFFIQRELELIEKGIGKWINLTLRTKKSYPLRNDYNWTEYIFNTDINVYKLRNYNTALFRDTLNKKDLILNYDFDVEISSGDRNKTQDVSFDINYFCSGKKFIIDLVKDSNVYYCLCEDKGFCLNDRPCACIVYPERFVDSSREEDGNLPKVHFNALYSFDPRLNDETELYYKWYMTGLQKESIESLNIKEGTLKENDEVANFNLTIRQEGDYYTSVSVSSNEKEDTDFVNFLFSPKDLPYCQRDGSKWIIGGEEIQLINSLDNCYMENGYNKKVCCPAGYKCDGGSCVASLDYSDCGDYITKETCDADDYNVGLKSVEEINGEYFCSSIQFLDDGNQIYVHDCKCSWDEEQGNCGTKNNQTGYNSGGTINYQITGSCEMKVSNIIGNCDTDDFKVYNMKAVWESESPESEIPSYCKDQTKKIECGNLVLLNFFDTTQVILTILIIILVYLIIFRIKKKN